MSDLAAFLRARLGEDEQIARQAAAESGPGWDTGGGGSAGDSIWGDAPGVAFPVVYDEGRPLTEEAAHIARHDPARVLADVAAKRALIAHAFHNAAQIDGEWGCGHSPDEIEAGRCDDYGRDAARDVLVLLAQPFADHPEFDPAWRQTT